MKCSARKKCCLTLCLFPPHKYSLYKYTHTVIVTEILSHKALCTNAKIFM